MITIQCCYFCADLSAAEKSKWTTSKCLLLKYVLFLLLLNAGTRKDEKKRWDAESLSERTNPLVLNIGSKKSTIITTRGSHSLFFLCMFMRDY